jgi:hypothetical protein
VDHRLKVQVVIGRKVVRHAFSVCDRCDKHVTPHLGVLAQEDQRNVVSVGDVVEGLGVAAKQFTDETS